MQIATTKRHDSPQVERRKPEARPEAETRAGDGYDGPRSDSWTLDSGKAVIKGAAVFGLPSVLATTVHPLAGLAAAAFPIGHSMFVSEDQGAAGRGVVGVLGMGFSLLPKPWALAGAAGLTIFGAIVGKVLADSEAAMDRRL